MKRLIALVAVIALAAGMVMAAPTIYGSNGMFRTINAQNAGPMNFGIGMHAYGWGWADTTGDKNMSMYLNFPIEGYFSINDMLELSVAPVYSMNSRYFPVWSGTPLTMKMTKFSNNGLLDTRVGLKLSLKASESMFLGLYAGYDIPTLSDTLNPYHASTVYKHNGAIHGLLLDQMNFGDACLNINAGLSYDLDKFEVAGVNYVYPNMGIPYGVGFSYKLGFVTPMVEFNGMYVMDTTSTYSKITGYTTAGLPIVEHKTKRGLLNNPTWATGVLRFGLGALNIDLGGEYNLQTKDTTLDARLNNNEHWHAIFGLAYAPVKEAGPKVAPTGIIAGKVTDSKGKPLAATITVAGMTFNADPATGNYTASGIQITGAPAEIKAEMKGYIAKTGSVVLTKKNKKTPAAQDFMLDLKPIPQSEITGNLIDYKTGSPVTATLAFKDAKGKTLTTTTNAKGAYSIKLDPGKYDVQVAAEGYNAKGFIVNAADGKPVSQNAALVKVKEVFVFNNINFATAKSAITPEIETALQPMLKVLLDNPDLKVEIGGHTDAIGSKVKNQKLSQARADAVKAWLMTNNVKAQMTAMGYGSSVPVSDNKTKAGRAANRRIEVKVIQ